MVAEKSPLDTVKLVLAAGLLGAGVVGFYWFEDQSQLYRVLGLLAVAAVAVAIALTTQVGRNAWGAIQAARNEVRKVVWPTRQETVQTTLIVLVMTLIVAIFLWLVDVFSLWAVGWLTGQGG